MENGSAPVSAEQNRLTDPVRLRRLRETGLLADDHYPSLDRLASAAAQQAGAPVALVSMVDADRQFFASQVGLGEPWASRRGTPMSHSFCQYVVIDDAPLIVPDARADPLLRDSPAIEDLRVAACAGYPLHAPGGEVLGSFCVIDTVPREWTPQELAIVRALATAAETAIALRTANRDLLRTTERMRQVLDTANDAFVSTDADGVIIAWNIAATALFGYAAAEAIDRPVSELIMPARFRAAQNAGLRRVRETGASILSGQPRHPRRAAAPGHRHREGHGRQRAPGRPAGDDPAPRHRPRRRPRRRRGSPAGPGQGDALGLDPFRAAPGGRPVLHRRHRHRRHRAAGAGRPA